MTNVVKISQREIAYFYGFVYGTGGHGYSIDSETEVANASDHQIDTSSGQP